MPEPSIHHQRRWYYALWTSLLLASSIALFLWERPVRRELATVCVMVQIPGAPKGTQVQAWAGPWSSWKGARWSGADAFCSMPLAPTGRTSLAPVRLHIARRRWGPGTIPRGTWDLVMLRFVPPQGNPVYLAVPCSQDIRTGLIRQGLKLYFEINTPWENLPVDAGAPLRVP
jgi:hypothetical protein